MVADPKQQREDVHSLVDKLPSAKLGAVREMLELVLDEDTDSLSAAEAKAISAAAEWSKHNAPIPHEQVLADLGLTVDDWERMSRER